VDKLHQGETQYLHFADCAFRTFCIYLYAIQSGRPWTGGGGDQGVSSKRTKLDQERGKKSQFLVVRLS